MTECNTGVELSKIGTKKVCMDFSGGDLSSDGGFILLRELENKHGFIKRFSECILDPRDPERVVHDQKTLITQRVFQICAGYEDVNDCSVLRKDRALQVACGRQPTDEDFLGSQPTLTRLENRVTREDQKRLRRFFVDEFIKSLPGSTQEIVLDVDGFADETHGNQQLSFFHGFYEHHIFHPVFITHSPSGFPVVLQLRAGNSHAGKGIKGILRWVFWRLRREFPGVRIILRADGGFSLPEIMSVCDKQAVEYAIGFACNPVLERKNEFFLDQVRVEFARTGQKVRRFNDTYYKAESWSQLRRMIMKSEAMEQGLNQRFVVTTLLDDPQKVYDQFYVLRAEHSENRIKELKIDLKSDRLSCHQFLANQFRLMLHQLSYLLLLTLRGRYVVHTEFARSRFCTLRLSLIKIAVRIKKTSRRILCQFSSSTPFRRIFTSVISLLLSSG